MSCNERIKNAREILELSQKEFADGLGISRGYVGDIEIGRCTPSYNFVVGLAETYKISIDWIATGQGHMFLHDDNSNNKPENNETTPKGGQHSNEEYLHHHLEDHVKLIEQLDKAVKKAEKQVDSAFKEVEGVLGLIKAKEQDLSREMR